METLQGGLTLTDKLRISKAYRLVRDLELPVCKSIMCALILEGEMTVTEITTAVSWIDNAEVLECVISKHLGILRRCSIVTYEEDGTKHVYTIDKERIKHINSVLAEFLGPDHTDLPGESIGDS